MSAYILYYTILYCKLFCNCIVIVLIIYVLVLGVAMSALSPFKYIGGALFGVITGALQSMNLLI
jgi:hypothetical protein